MHEIWFDNILISSWLCSVKDYAAVRIDDRETDFLTKTEACFAARCVVRIHASSPLQL